MGRTKRLFYNSVTTLIQQLAVMLAGFIIPRIMMTSYGSEINGLVSSVSQFISYFNLVEAGLAGAAIYALYKPLATGDHKKINAVISGAKRFYNISGYIFVSLTIGLAVIYPAFVKTEAASPIEVGILVLILGTGGALEFFTLSKYRALLTADQKTYVISIASIVQVLVHTGTIIVMSRLGAGIVLLRFTALLAVFLRSFILLIYVRRKYKYINYKEQPDKSALDRRWDVLYLQILGAVHTGTPVVLATIFTDLKTVSVYSIFNMVIGGMNSIIGITTNGMSASFGDVIARGEKDVLKRAYTEFEFLYYSLLAIVYAIAVLMLMPFINIYTKGITDVNYNLPFLGFLFILNGLLFNMKTPQGMMVVSAGLYKETRVQTTVQGLIAVLGGIALAPFLGLAGILIGSILSNLYRTIDLMLYIPKTVTGLGYKGTLLRQIGLVAMMAVICVPFCFLDIAPGNYGQWVMWSAAIGVWAIVAALLFAAIFERKTLKGVAARVKIFTGVKK